MKNGSSIIHRQKDRGQIFRNELENVHHDLLGFDQILITIYDKYEYVWSKQFKEVTN